MTDRLSNWKPGDPIGYISPQIPECEMPPYRGERYEAMVPDTLDLAERPPGNSRDDRESQSTGGF